MGFIDIFVKPDEGNKKDTKKVENSKPQIQEDVIPQAPISIPQVQSSPVVGSNEAINENKKVLWKTLIDRNLPGPDMLEVLNTAGSLKGMGMTREKELEASCRMLKNQYPNFTKEILLNSVDTYIGFINEELEDGTRQFAKKREDTVGSKEATIRSLEKDNNDIEAQIAELRKKQNENNSRITSLRSEVAKEAGDLEKQESVFKSSIVAVIEELNENKKLMSNLNI